MRKILFATLTLFFINASICLNAASTPLGKPVSMAHRGGNVDTDENTLASYKNAIKYGMDYIECDPRPTKDGVLIIMHDASVDRTTNGSGLVSDMTLAEIKSLSTKKGETVPTLEEVLLLARESGTRVYLDTKQVDAAYMKLLVEEVAELGMSERVMLGLWDTEQLKWVENNRPDMASNIPYPMPVSNLKKGKKMGADWIGMTLEQATPKNIAAADSAGLKVVTMPINDRKTIVAKIKEGMHVIQTDNPKLLREILDEMFGGK